MRLIAAGLLKLRTRTATWVAAIVAALLIGVELVLVGVSLNLPASATGGPDPTLTRWLVTFPGAYDAILSLVFALGGLIALIWVAAVAGTEWSWGTMRNAVVRGESRTRYTLGLFGSIAAILFLGMLTTFAAGIVGALLGCRIAGLNPGDILPAGAIPHVLASIVRCWIALTCLASVGFALTMAARSQMAGVGTVIGVYLASVLAPLALPDFLRRIFDYLPFSIAGDAMALYGPPVKGEASQISAIVEPTMALLVTIAWLVASLSVAVWATERVEIKN